MSSRRSGSRPSVRKSRLGKSNNIQLYKLMDPIVQSVFFIFFLYCLDSQTTISYRAVLLLLVGWQLLSVIIHFFLWDLKLLKTERILYFVIMLFWVAFFLYFKNELLQNKIALDQGQPKNIPIYQVIIMTVGMVIAFWYVFICYREFRNQFGSVNRGNNR